MITLNQGESKAILIYNNDDKLGAATFVESGWSFFLEDPSKAMFDAEILRIDEGLVDQSHLDDLEGLHDEHLSPPRNCSPHEPPEKICCFCHSLQKNIWNKIRSPFKSLLTSLSKP